MKMKALVTTGMIFMLPAMTQAAEWGGMVTLGFSKTDVSGTPVDVTTTTLDFNGVYDFQNGFSMGFDAGLAFGDISNGGPDVDLTYFALNGEYKLQNGVTFGGYFERGSVDDGGVLIGNSSIRSYGLTVGYETDQLDTEVYFGKSETSPSLPAGVDIKDYGVRVGYQLSPQAFAVGALGRSEISGLGPKLDLDMIALGGGYAFSNQFSAYGGIQRVSVDVANLDATTFGLGVAYSPSAISNMPMVFSLELARTRLDAGGPTTDLDTIRLGVSLPLGKAGGDVPANSVVNNIAKGGHNVLTSGILGAF